jgi:hypothetical protein
MGIRLFAGVVLLAVALVSVQAAEDKDKKDKETGKGNTHEGIVIKAGNGKLTMTGGKDKKDHTHDVPDTAEITFEGKKVKLEDLKPGTVVKVTTKDEGKTAIKIEGTSKKDVKDKPEKDKKDS